MRRQPAHEDVARTLRGFEQPMHDTVRKTNETGDSMSTSNPERFTLSRRSALAGLTAAAATGIAATPAYAKDLVVGFIYVGPKDDYGYNQAHAEAAAVLKKMPGVKIVEEEKVAETDDVSKTMESMIKLDGASLLFPTSF